MAPPWLRNAHADLRREGAIRFWLHWRWGTPELRRGAYALGRFTPRARRVLDRFLIVQVPTGVAWAGAVAGAYLVPRWFPGAGALPRTPWIGAACLRPLPLIAGVAGTLTPEVIAHEFAHALWPRLPAELRRAFPAVLAELERRDPDLSIWLDECLLGYRERRSPDEVHVRLLERYGYGRRAMPEGLRPYYSGWVDLQSDA